MAGDCKGDSHCSDVTVSRKQLQGFCGLPWESDSSSASQAIHWFLWKQKVHYRIHNSRPVFSSLTHINPVDVTLSHSISSPILMLSSRSHPGLPHVSPPKSCTQLSPPRTCHRPLLHIPLDVITRIISGEQHKSQSSSLCSCLQSPSYFHPYQAEISLSKLFSNAPSLAPYLNVRDRVSHPYKTALIVITYNLLVYCVMHRKREVN